jgi:CRP/FNR family transcriptional regulator
MLNTTIPNSSFDRILQEELLSFGTTKHLVPDTRLIKEGEYIRSVPIVLSGSIRVLQMDDEGRELLLYYIRPGESCIMSFLAGVCNGKSKISAITEEETEVIMVPLAKAQEWVKKYPSWNEFIFRLYEKRFEELLNVVNAIAFQHMDKRLHNLLLTKSEVTGNKELITTHQQIADELGTAREVVSRLLKQMEKENLVELKRNKIIIL